MVSVPGHRGQGPEGREARAEASVGTQTDDPQTRTPGCGHVLLGGDPAPGVAGPRCQRPLCADVTPCCCRPGPPGSRGRNAGDGG